MGNLEAYLVPLDKGDFGTGLHAKTADRHSSETSWTAVTTYTKSMNDPQ